MGGEKMADINISLQVIPLVEPTRVYPIVDKVIGYIKSTGVKYLVGPMETTMEGELDTLMDIVKEAQRICETEGADRIISMVKIDYSPKGVTMEEKIYKYREES